MLPPTKALNIIVVGGSLGGLMNAIVLKRQGHNIRLLERTPTALLHDQGAGIVVQDPTHEWFAKYDRTKTPFCVTTNERRYLNQTGDTIHSLRQGQEMTSWDLLYNILRANFDGGGDRNYCPMAETKDGDGKVEYLYGKKVIDLEDKGQEGVEVSFEDVDGKKGSMTGDMVIAADGPSSAIRAILEPQTKREYAGYVAWRGTVPESELSPEAQECFVDHFIFFHSDALQILAYLIPGKDGAITRGNRLVNYVWYCNYPEGSDIQKEVMTDTSGKQRTFTMPAGKISPSVWEKQKLYAAARLPPQFSELVQKMKKPFIQAITDVLSKKQVFMGGKVILVGDAVCGLRPHTAASTSQAAMHAMLLDEVFRGRITLKKWEEQTVDWAGRVSAGGRAMGDRSQFGSHPLSSSSAGGSCILM